MINLKSSHKPIKRIKQIKERFNSNLVLFLILIISFFISCSYYTVKDLPTVEENISKQIDSFNTAKKYVIIHSDSISWHLKNMVLNDDEQNISGVVMPITINHVSIKPRDEKRVHRYNFKNTDPLNEVHFYLKTPTTFPVNKNVTIPLKDINRMSVNDKNTGRAVVNVLLTTVGTVFFVSALYAALKSSCPFVYIKDGETFRFVGELYPGRITPHMQDDDYLALPSFNPKNEIYTLKVSNQLKEIQYTDQLQLLVADHPRDMEVLLDRKGNLQTIQNLVAPKQVTVEGENKDLSLVLKKDNNNYAFNSFQSTFSSTRSIVLEFNRPKDVKEAKLYLTAKNSVWLDYVFGKFNEQFGSYYNTFQKKQQEVRREELLKWKQGQNIPLSVYIKTRSGWVLVERISSVGPLAMRDLVLPIDLNTIDKDVFQIKLETGFMFWEVDFAGIDFTKNLDIDLKYIDPISAADQYGNDVTHLLKATDQKYFVQPNIGDEVVVNFRVASSKDSSFKTSVFLKNRGYYNYIRDYKGSPDREKLQSFREDGAFTRYSEKAYFEFINFSLNNLAQNE